MLRSSRPPVPDDVSPQHGVLRLGNWAEFIGRVDWALRLKPDIPEAHHNLGFALAQTGQLQKAIGQYEQALRLKPDYPDAHPGAEGRQEDLRGQRGRDRQHRE